MTDATGEGVPETATYLRQREAINLLLSSGDVRGAATQAQSLLDKNPRDFFARKRLVRAQTLLGNSDEVLRLFTSEFADDRKRLQLREVVVEAATAALAFPKALALSQLATKPDSLPPWALFRLLRLADTSEDLDALEVEIGACEDEEARLPLSALLLAEKGDRHGALAQLLRVDPKNDKWAIAARRLYRLALVHQEDDTARIIGTLLIQHDPDCDVGTALNAGFAAAGAGDLFTAKQAFERAQAQCGIIRADAGLFANKWASVARAAFQIFEVKAGLADMERARRLQLPGADDVSLETERLDFLAEFSGELDWAHRMTLSLLGGAPMDFPRDEIVRIILPQVNLFQAGSRKEIGSIRCRLKLIAETLRQARQAGGQACLVLEGLAGEAGKRKAAPLSLSYHSHGQAAGTIHFKEADLTRYATIDPGGYSGWSTLADRALADLGLEGFSAGDMEAFHRRFIAETIQSNISKYAQPKRLHAAALPRRYVFVAMQIPTDKVQALGRFNAVEMLELVVRRFAGTDIKVVAKRHPMDTDRRTAEALSRMVARGCVIVRTDSVHDLIAGAEAVITVNSGVGSEALHHLKPVYLFGKADYAPACHNVMDENDFLSKTSPIGLPCGKAELKAFLYYYRCRYLVDIDDSARLSEAVNTRIIAPALEAFRADQGQSKSDS